MNLLQKSKNKLAQCRKEYFSFQNALISMLVVLLLAFVSVMVWDVPRIYELLGLREKSEVLKFIGIGMGGILVALQALMSYKRAKALEDTAQAQADAVSKTEQGQRQERLKNAIEHLGHSSDSVRLGGAYELFHLAQDTEELRQTVFDILCAHIRQTTSEETYGEAHESKPSEEIQSLLTLLFVLDHEVFKGLRINFQGSWLNGADLWKARLEKAVLVGVNLQKAALWDAQMQGAILIGARMQDAVLTGAQMQKAVLTGAQMQGTILERAQMQGTMLTGAQMQKATLTGTQMQKAVLAETHLQGAILERAQMQGAMLTGTHLQGAILEGTYLQGAILEGTHLQGAMLTGAQMQGVTSHRDSSASFEKRIRERIDKESDLAGVISEDQSIQELMRGATTGSYTAEEAEKWIAEYKEAMSEVRVPS